MDSKKKTPDALLTELQRQEKYLKELPGNFEFPLFNTRYAIESQRQSAYKHTAAAAREIVDNAIEAKANKIHIIFERPKARQKGERAESISSIAFIDNGAGMLPQMARFALSWGGGTHFDEPNFIGKFGFGLPNASINQTRLVEVFTRTKAEDSFTKAVLDIRSPEDHALHTIPPPTTSELPDFVQRYLTDEMKEPLAHGTVVVWRNPDRLRYRTPAKLKEHLIDDFGAVYRYLLDGSARGSTFADLPKVQIVIEGKQVEPVDPLFLTPGCLYYQAPDAGGAQKTVDRSIPVRYVLDDDGLHLQKVNGPEDLKHPRLVAAGSVQVVIARFPYEFVNKKKAQDPVAYKRLQIRKPRRGMSFVRAGREIDTFDAFPKSSKDEADALGYWPQMQSYALHYGVEVRFTPSLDAALGVGNDKQTVHPTEDFWRLLAQEKIDEEMRKENAWQVEERQIKETPKAQPADVPTEGELAMTTADAAQGAANRVPDGSKKEAAENLQREAEKVATSEAKKRAEVEGKPFAPATQAEVDAALAALREDEKRRRYHVDYVDDPNGPFFTPEWRGDVVVAKINRAHIFYQVLYGELLKMPGASLAKEALDVLLLVLAKGELRTEDPNFKVFYETQRKNVWSAGIEPAYNFLKARIVTDRPETEMQDLDAA